MSVMPTCNPTRAPPGSTPAASAARASTRAVRGRSRIDCSLSRGEVSVLRGICEGFGPAKGRSHEPALGAGATQACTALLASIDAHSADSPYSDILFQAAFYLWEIARREGNVIQEKVYFGRLRHLRSALERHFDEVTQFDAYIERGGRGEERAVRS